MKSRFEVSVFKKYDVSSDRAQLIKKKEKKKEL